MERMLRTTITRGENPRITIYHTTVNRDPDNLLSDTESAFFIVRPRSRYRRNSIVIRNTYTNTYSSAYFDEDGRRWRRILFPEDTDSDTDSDSDSDSESDSGQVRILGSDHTYLTNSHQRAMQTGGSNLDNFHKSEMCFLTKQDSGLLNPRLAANKSITDMISKRESGRLKTGDGFSVTERRAIANNKLPIRMKVIDTYESKAFSGIYSHDGNLLLTASQDRYLRVYDASNGCTFKLLKRVQGRDVGWSILGTAFSPDSSRFAYSSWSSSLYMVDLDGDSTTHTSLDLLPEERRFAVFSLQFSSNGKEILCGANDKHLYIYDLEANERILRVKAHSDDLNTVTFADNTSQILYSGSDDGFCKVWDRRTLSETSPNPVGVLAGHLDGVVYIDSKGDARHFISNSKDQSIKLWDIRMLSGQAAQENTRRAVGNHKWDYRWQGAPKKLINRKSNMKGDTSLATYRGHSVLQTQIRCHFSPAFTTGQRYIYTGCAFGRIIAYDILTGSIALKLQGHSSCVRDVSWHPYRPEIVSSSWDFSIVCWNHFANNPNVEDLEDEDSESRWSLEALDDNWATEGRGLRRSKRIADRNRMSS